MAEKKKVVFRRIRGRIIPIRVREIQKGKREVALGSGVAAGSAIVGGLAVRRINKEERKIKRAARAAGKNIRNVKFRDQVGKAGKTGSKIIRAARKNLFKRRFTIGLTALGTTVGALLVETGAGRIAENRNKEPRIKTQFKENVSAIGTAAASSILFGGVAGGKRGAFAALQKAVKRGKGF